MCITKFEKHECGHLSTQIIAPCKNDRNFTNCPSFYNGKARNPSKYPQVKTDKKDCPKCDKKDDYDRNLIRMVTGVKGATRFGFGPSKSDFGIDIEEGPRKARRVKKAEMGLWHCTVM